LVGKDCVLQHKDFVFNLGGGRRVENLLQLPVVIGHVRGKRVVVAVVIQGVVSGHGRVASLKFRSHRLLVRFLGDYDVGREGRVEVRRRATDLVC